MRNVTKSGGTTFIGNGSARTNKKGQEEEKDGESGFPLKQQLLGGKVSRRRRCTLIFPDDPNTL